MSKTSPADRSKLILPDLDCIATQTNLVVRKSPRFSPDAFLQCLLSAVATGKASFNQMVAELADRTEKPMARQSMHERIGINSTAFLLSVLCDLMKQRFKPAVLSLKGSPIWRVIIEDSSGQAMPKSNAQDFPAHGNHHGETAGAKIDLAYDLLSGEVLSHSLHSATEQDKVIGRELVAEIREGDLVLRDMGYFSLSEFTAIEACGAWWLTRLPLTTGVVLTNGKPLEKFLGGRKKDILDLRVVAGSQRKACRLVAMRAAPEVAAARRAERREKARKSGKKPCKTGLIRDGWHLMLTNLKPSQADVSQLAQVYRARWAIEIQFRAWKQSINLAGALNRKSNEHHMQALVIAGMIAHQLGLRMARMVSDQMGRARLSYEKLYDILAVRLVKVRDIAELFAFTPDPRHVERDKRKRESSIESGIRALA